MIAADLPAWVWVLIGLGPGALIFLFVVGLIMILAMVFAVGDRIRWWRCDHDWQPIPDEYWPDTWRGMICTRCDREKRV